MIEVPNPEELTDFNLKNIVLPPLDKYVDRRGFIYILYDKNFPDHIKIGRTFDLFKRLTQYNSDKPYRTANMLFISDIFEDVNETERKILAFLYSKTNPTTFAKEWFEIEHKEIMIKAIEKAEKLEKESKKSKESKDCIPN